jgi:hypothetical protein
MEMEQQQQLEFDVDYDQDEVEQLLKSQESIILNQRITKLEQSLINTINELQQKIAELELPSVKIRGNNPVHMIPYGKGLKVYGDGTRENKELLKEAGGSWNPTLKGWIFPIHKRDELLNYGVLDELSLV